MVSLAHRAAAQQVGEREAVFLQKLPRIFFFHILIDPDDGEVGPVDGMAQAVEQGELFAARSAPAGPERHESHAAVQISQAEPVTVEGLQIEAPELAPLPSALGEQGGEGHLEDGALRSDEDRRPGVDAGGLEPHSVLGVENIQPIFRDPRVGGGTDIEKSIGSDGDRLLYGRQPERRGPVAAWNEPWLGRLELHRTPAHPGGPAVAVELGHLGAAQGSVVHGALGIRRHATGVLHVHVERHQRLTHLPHARKFIRVSRIEGREQRSVGRLGHKGEVVGRAGEDKARPGSPDTHVVSEGWLVDTLESAAPAIEDQYVAGDFEGGEQVVRARRQSERPIEAIAVTALGQQGALEPQLGIEDEDLVVLGVGHVVDAPGVPGGGLVIPEEQTGLLNGFICVGRRQVASGAAVLDETSTIDLFDRRLDPVGVHFQSRGSLAGRRAGDPDDERQPRKGRDLKFHSYLLRGS